MALNAKGEQPAMDSRSMRIAVLHFSHETVTFLSNDTTLADFENDEVGLPLARDCKVVVSGASAKCVPAN